ncbi:DUF6607 family protein [Novosphingobium sp. P6W]|uniref:DUF6607 family protein n=1 Tax=Novosphingobium sp. P6W TaxID=1609758 RepID=UPI0005C2CD5C|nr:DUF6607 family protein [Novosphingobium sp. P6W]AXB79683.1 hypothetical protein TQ38_024955 [Novosphingobium sp. P6W]KIS34400.1 hypothetical protein TQ38_02075 [Novosphingobium sp. P6W]
MNRITTFLATGLLSIALATSPAMAHPPISADKAAAGFEQDHADILAMAGTFKVRFDMQESTPWVAGYTPLERKISGGDEVVRVVEDTGRKIVLQHMLVVEHEGQTMVIKHWRQDWEYEPARVLVYADRNTWKWEDVPEKFRIGRWSQTVFQVDDSPRYGGWGQFETQGGVRRWRSNWTWRPLARRDAVRNPVYDRYLSINRHQNTPDGWIHWQDNTKMGVKDGKLVPIVQEYLLNTYTRFDGYNVKAADDYWAATRDYWAQVRAEWARVAEVNGGIAVDEKADTGTVISGRLMELADHIQAGKIKTAKAAVEARKLIAANTRKI